MDWWKTKLNYDKLSDLPRKYLCAPPASNYLAQPALYIYEALRKRLMGEKAAKLLFIKYNLPLLKFDY